MLKEQNGDQSLAVSVLSSPILATQIEIFYMTMGLFKFRKMYDNLLCWTN